MGSEALVVRKDSKATVLSGVSAGPSVHQVPERIQKPSDYSERTVKERIDGRKLVGRKSPREKTDKSFLACLQVQRPGVMAAIALDVYILRILAGLAQQYGRLNTDLQV